MAVSFAYTLVGWTLGSAPYINGANLVHLDTGVQQGAHLSGLESDRTAALATANPGALMFCTDTKILYQSLGAGTWQQITAPIGDTAWTALTLGGTWATSAAAIAAGEQAPHYRKDGSGFVHVDGYLDTGFSTGVAIGTLPAGYRPLKTHRFPAFSSGTVTGDTASDRLAGLIVKSDGTINWDGHGSSFIQLDLIDFLAEQ